MLGDFAVKAEKLSLFNISYCSIVRTWGLKRTVGSTNSANTPLGGERGLRNSGVEGFAKSAGSALFDHVPDSAVA
jgi:hypothetical protein